MLFQGDLARAALVLLVIVVTGVQLASVGVSSAREPTAIEAAGYPVPVKSAELTTTVKSVPTNTSSVGSDLLDHEKLDFLLNCQATRERFVKSKDALLCAVYRNLSTVLAARKQDSVTAKTVRDMLSEQQDPTEKDKFCENLSSVLVALRKTAEANHEQERFNASKLEEEPVCTYVCLPMNEDELQVTLKPICRVLLWGFRKMLVPDVAVDPVVQAAEVVIPPELAQEAKPEKVEPEANAPPKPVVTKPVQQSVSPAHVTSSTLADNAVVVGKPIETDAKPPVDTAKAVEPKKPTEEKKPTDDEDAAELFVDQEAKNKQNLEDINGEGGPKEGDDPTDEDALYPENDGDSEEDPSVDTNVPTPAAVGTAPKEVAVREQQKQSLPHFMGSSKDEISLDDVRRHELPDDPFFEESDSNFFSYFLFVMFACIVCYVAYHNKSKLLALALEGRRSSSGRGGFSKGRKHTAAYRKLDSNLEEAITSNTAASSRSQQQIIY